jgi:predicted acylesterase/phospholipase RssA
MRLQQKMRSNVSGLKRIALLLLGAATVSAHAETVALALSGGGARGFAHIGLLQLLEEENLRPDLIVGTSMGAVIGGLYGAGYTPAELRSIAVTTDWSNLFLDQPSRRNLFLGKKETISRHILSLRFRNWVPEVPLALSTGQKLSELLFNLVHRAPYQPCPSFDDLRVPFRAVATDVVSGRPIVFSRGDLAEAMRASISLPLVFAPYRLDALRLVDGGVVENIPVDIARSLGATVVIALDATTGLEGEGGDLPWELADRVTTIMQGERNAQSLSRADVAITPDLGLHRSTDFTHVEELIDAGYCAAKAHLPELRAALARSTANIRTSSFCSHAVFERFLDSLPGRALPPTRYTFSGVTLFADSSISLLSPGLNGLNRLTALRQLYVNSGSCLAQVTALDLTADGTLYSRWEEGRIRSVSVAGLRRYKPWTLLNEFPLREGDLFDLRRARRGIGSLYGSDVFESVALSIVNNDGGADLTIRAEERPSPQLRMGAGFSIERKGRGFLEFLNDNMLNTGARLSLFGKYGERDEEARASVTLDQMPVRTIVDELLQSRLTTDVSASWKREEYDFFTSSHRDTAFYFFERSTAELWYGRAFRRWGELSAGVRYQDVRVGGVLIEPVAHLTFLGVRTIVDTKDSYPFPNSGIGLNARYEYALQSRSGGRPFNRLIGLGDGYLPLTNRLVLHGRADYAWNDRILPMWGRFLMGGEESMLGLHVAERYGNCRVTVLGEIRYDLISRWLADAYLSALYTIGAVSPESRPVPRASEYQHGVGAAFALSTFLGPMKLTAGQLLSSPYGTRQFRIYLNLGHEF